MLKFVGAVIALIFMGPLVILGWLVGMVLGCLMLGYKTASLTLKGLKV